MKSVEYYNINAEDFYHHTIGIDMNHAYEVFLPLLPKHAKILDAGCGTGRDAKYFLEKGYEITAFDASLEMVKRSTVLLQKPTLALHFEDMTFKNEFDAVWACASLLHVPYEQTKTVFEKIHQALKSAGIFYASYKYGHGKMPAEGRDFYLMDEHSIMAHIRGLFEPIKIWQTNSTIKHKAPSPSNTWLNLLCRKRS